MRENRGKTATLFFDARAETQRKIRDAALRAPCLMPRRLPRFMPGFQAVARPRFHIQVFPDPSADGVLVAER